MPPAPSHQGELGSGESSQRIDGGELNRRVVVAAAVHIPEQSTGGGVEEDALGPVGGAHNTWSSEELGRGEGRPCVSDPGEHGRGEGDAIAFRDVEVGDLIAVGRAVGIKAEGVRSQSTGEDINPSAAIEVVIAGPTIEGVVAN